MGSPHWRAPWSSALGAGAALVALGAASWTGCGGSSGGSSSRVCMAPSTLCAGACVETQNDPANCGGCGMACSAGQFCSGGTCMAASSPCTGGSSLCNGACVETQNDPQNCGTCGAACPTGQVCSMGKCGVICLGGSSQCGSKCVDEQNDPTNCGACGTTCLANQVCSGGKCAFDCPVAAVACEGSCIDPGSNLTYCGATAGCSPDAGTAGTPCPSGTACVHGACATLVPPTSNILLWLKADGIQGATDGSSIASWVDASGNGRTAIQSRNANQPSYKANGLNGLPVVHFSASAGTFLTTPFQLFATSSSPLTLFVVFRATAVTSQRFLVTQPQVNCVNNVELGYDVGGSMPVGSLGVHAGCGIAAVTSTAITANTWYIAAVEFASTGTTPTNVTFYEDGVAQTSAAASGGWVAPGNYGTLIREVVIGARDSINNGAYDGFHDGDIAEVLAYSVVDTALRNSVESYLHSKWGI